jgi:hypothetical protein
MEEKKPALSRILGWTPEDTLRLRLRQSLVPGRTRPRYEEDIVFAAGLAEAPARGRSGRHHRLHGVGAVFDT